METTDGLSRKERFFKAWNLAGLLNRHSKRLGLYAGLLIVVAFTLMALLADVVAPYPPAAQDTTIALAGPGEEHLLGTDELGRDIFSRLVFGARFDLVIAVSSIGLAYLIALPFGLSAGYFGGRADTGISTVSDSILTFPSLVLAIVLVNIFGVGLTGLVLTIAVTQAPALVRYIRGFVLQVRDMDFIEAARAIGANNSRILFVHVFQNTVGPAMVILSLMASEALLVAAALGFLGLGVQPPAPEWGTMLSRGRTYFAQAPHLMIFPGMAIALLVLGFNLLGDGLRDLFDKRR